MTFYKKFSENVIFPSECKTVEDIMRGLTCFMSILTQNVRGYSAHIRIIRTKRIKAYVSFQLFAHAATQQITKILLAKSEN